MGMENSSWEIENPKIGDWDLDSLIDNNSSFPFLDFQIEWQISTLALYFLFTHWSIYILQFPLYFFLSMTVYPLLYLFFFNFFFPSNLVYSLLSLYFPITCLLFTIRLFLEAVYANIGISIERGSSHHAWLVPLVHKTWIGRHIETLFAAEVLK